MSGDAHNNQSVDFVWDGIDKKFVVVHNGQVHIKLDGVPADVPICEVAERFNKSFRVTDNTARPMFCVSHTNLGVSWDMVGMCERTGEPFEITQHIAIAAQEAKEPEVEKRRSRRRK